MNMNGLFFEQWGWRLSSSRWTSEAQDELSLAGETLADRGSATGTVIPAHSRPVGLPEMNLYAG